MSHATTEGHGAQAGATLAVAPRSDYCIFLRDGRRFALSTRTAKEVLEARPFTPVPHAPPELLGAFNLRGEVIPLVNLDRFLEVEGRPAGRADTLLLLSNADVVLAAVVDQVVIIKHVSPWEIRRASLDPQMRNPLARGSFGRDDEQTLVLDGERLIAGVVEQIAAGFRGRSKSVQPSTSGGGGVRREETGGMGAREDTRETAGGSGREPGGPELLSGGR